MDATTVAVVMNNADFINQLVSWAEGIVLAALGILGTWVLLWLKAKMQREALALDAAQLNIILNNAVAYGQGRAKERGMDITDAHDPIIAEAVGYAQMSGGALLTKFKTSDDQLKMMLAARLAKLDPSVGGANPTPVTPAPSPLPVTVVPTPEAETPKP